MSNLLKSWLNHQNGIDPAPGSAAGFGGVILHGLSTFGFGARALIATVGGGDPRSLKSFSVRFTSPVKPGDVLETQAWEVGNGPNGTTEVAFITNNVTSGKVGAFLCLSGTFYNDHSSVSRSHWAAVLHSYKNQRRVSYKHGQKVLESVVARSQ
jgi:hypothetical protein